MGGGGRRRPRGDPAELQKSNVRNAHTPRRRPQNKYHALCPQPQKTGVGPSDGWSRSREGASRRGRPPGRPRFRRFPGNHPAYSADPSARSAPAASDEALLCAEAGASSPEEHGRRPVEAEGLTLLVKGFSGAGHPPLGPVPCAYRHHHHRCAPAGDRKCTLFLANSNTNGRCAVGSAGRLASQLLGSQIHLNCHPGLSSQTEKGTF